MTLHFAGVLATAIVFALPMLCAPPSQKPVITTVMYLVNRPNSIASFKSNAGKTSIIAPQTFSMDAQGFIAGEVPPEVVQIAAANRVAVMPLVVNRRFDQPLMHSVLDSRDARQRAIRYLLYYALRDGYLGFQFDFENIHYTYRDKFTTFFKEAAHEFHKHGLQISAAIVGRLDDTRNSNSPGGYDNWSGVYDYDALGKYADFISVMAYAEHGAASNPGPVAGLPWLTKIADYSARTLGARKVSLGVPFYGMRWDEVDAASIPDRPGQPPRKWRGRSVRYSDVIPLLKNTDAVWDAERHSPHLSFDTQGRRTELWFENSRSLQSKLRLAHQMRFPGVSAWVLGQEDPDFWSSLAEWQVRRPRATALTGNFDQRSRRAARILLAR